MRGPTVGTAERQGALPAMPTPFTQDGTKRATDGPDVRRALPAT